MEEPPLSLSSTEGLRDALFEDVRLCEAAIKRDDTQTNRRNYLRAVFAFVEGILSILKSSLLWEYEAHRCRLHHGEIALLLEEGYHVQDDGHLRIHPSFVPAKANVRFTFDLYVRALGLAAKRDYTGTGWQQFGAALQIRNRITHPKANADLAISDADLQCLGQAQVWFTRTSLEIVLYHTNALKNPSWRPNTSSP